jgi:insulysin
MWKILGLIKNFANPENPFSYFSIGSIDSLETEPKEMGIDTYNEILSFYKKYYSSSIMKLVVSAPLSF